MKLYIPRIGDRIRLLSDWTFDLYNEYRNDTLLQFVNDPRKSSYGGLTAAPCTIQAGEILKVDRMYIRKGQAEYDSMTFFWEGQKTAGGMRPVWYSSTVERKTPARAIRFWVKLDDANKIEFEQVA